MKILKITKHKMRIVRIDNNDQWREFFELYRNLPEIWQIKNDSYKNKNLRYKGWLKLLAKYKEIESDANLVTLKKRINNIRTCYRRELRKQIDVKNSGGGLDGGYESTLWYLKELEFLRDQEIDLPRAMKIENDAGDEEDEMPVSIEEQTSKRKKLSVTIKNEKCEFLRKAVNHLENIRKDNDIKREIRDDAEIFAASWACSYRKLTDEQKLYAKKAIDDILILGQLEKLKLNSVNIFESPISTPLFIQKYDSKSPPS